MASRRRLTNDEIRARFWYTQDDGYFYAPLLTADGRGIEAYVPHVRRAGIFTLGPEHNPWAGDFAVRVRGEHLRPKFADGDIVFARDSWATLDDWGEAYSGWGKVYRGTDGLVNVRRWVQRLGVDLLVADADDSVIFADEVELLGGANGRWRPEHVPPLLPV